MASCIIILPVDSKRILDKVKSREAKTRMTISIDPALLESFKKVCADRALSPVIEEMIREFVDSAKKPTR